MEVEYHRSANNGNGNARRNQEVIPCISKDLYDEPPQSEYVVIQLFYNILHTSFIVLSKLRCGQVLISILDYYMIKIINTLDFCLPDDYSEFAAQQIIDKHKRTLPIRDRPMSWLFFIPVLIFLRLFRFTLSIYCIMAGMGEVTAQHMQENVITFRRYYRSIRHYAIDKRTEDEEKVVADRKGFLFWRLYYRVYESIFMLKPIVEVHETNGDTHGKVKQNGRHKRDLDMSSSDSDDDLNAQEMLEKLEESSINDPDYEQNVTKSLGECSNNCDELEFVSNGEPSNSVEDSTKGDSTEQGKEDEGDKSNDDTFLTAKQLSELENDIMMKILDYFKDNYNFPSDIQFSGEIFYSPIDSPPENGIEHSPDSDETKNCEREVNSNNSGENNEIVSDQRDDV